MTNTVSSLGDLVDDLATIRHLNEAAHMAVGDVDLTTRATNALQALIHEIHLKLVSAEERLEQLIEAAEAGKKGGAA